MILNNLIQHINNDKNRLKKFAEKLLISHNIHKDYDLSFVLWGVIGSIDMLSLYKFIEISDTDIICCIYIITNTLDYNQKIYYKRYLNRNDIFKVVIDIV